MFFEKVFLTEFLFANLMFDFPLLIALLNFMNKFHMIFPKGSDNLCQFMILLLRGMWCLGWKEFIEFLLHLFPHEVGS